MTKEQRCAHAAKAIEAVRPRLPMLAGVAGRAWAAKFHSLPAQERADIITRMTIASLRAHAKRKGYPPPVVSRQLQDGSFVPYDDQRTALSEFAPK